MPSSKDKDKTETFFSGIKGIIVALTGLIVAITGLVAAYDQFVNNRPDETPTPVSAAPVPEDQDSEEPEEPVTPAPSFSNFNACEEPCNGNNAARSFAEKSKRVYVSYDYENIPDGAAYTRTWKNNGDVYISYACDWPGPKSGRHSVELYEAKGLRSGIWELTITVDGELLFQESFEIEGDWDAWDPVAEVQGECK